MRQCTSKGKAMTSSFVTGSSTGVNIPILTNSSSRNKLMFGLASQSLPIHQHASHSFTVSSTYACRGFSSTPEGANGAAESEEGKEQLEGEPVSPDEAAAGAPATDNAKIEKLEKDLKDMKDKALRALAEEENVRRIAKRDVDNAKAYANEKFAKSLLEVADNLDYAIAAANDGGKGVDKKADPIDNRTGADSATMLKNLVEGVEATNKGLLKAFAQFGVIKYGKVGDKFDPNLHDALFQVPDDTMEPNTVAQLLQPGYKMKDRVLRAAQVGTSTKAT